jgi:hypothetical protein
MFRPASLLLLTSATGVALAASPTTDGSSTSQTATTAGSPICKMVVSAEPGAKPYQLCMTKAEWEAKKIADAKDANRLVCRYQEDPKTRFRSFKICMTADQWENQRLEDRQAIDRVQMQSCVPGGGC